MEQIHKSASAPVTDITGQELVTGATEAEALLQKWRSEEARKSAPWRLAMIAAGLPVLLFFPALLFIAFVVPELAHQLGVAMPFVASYFFLYMFGVCSSSASKAQLTPVQKQIKTQLEGMTDVHAVVPMLKALPPADGSEMALRETILAPLTRLLIGMSHDEASIILPMQSEKLIYELSDGAYPDFTIAVLRLLPGLAEPRGLMVTARILMRDAPTTKGQRIRHAAREALGQLLESVDLGGIEALPGWISRLQDANNHAAALYTEGGLPYLAMMQLLPRCAPADYMALPTKDRLNLYLSLHGDWVVSMGRLRPDYTLVVLDMVRRAADVEALPTFYGLINGSGSTSPSPHVREAARACIPILKAQLEKEKVSKTLLRGASAPQATANTLLRPASAATATDPQQLLRANVGQTGSER